MPFINPALVTLALDKCGTDSFERYAQAAFAQLLGRNFKPLGGMADGGADGFVDESDVYEEVGRVSRYFQASKQTTVETKVRATVKRLRDVGRTVTTLYFASSQQVPFIDKVQQDLGDLLDIRLHIYDRSYFENHTNDTPLIQAAFESHLRPTLAFLEDLRAPSFPSNAPIPDAQALCAFLAQELERRMGTVKTLKGICESLILWALEGTDPDRRIFMRKEQIVEKVLGIIPSAKRFFHGQLDDSLETLTKKTDGTRRVNFHKKEKGYCLPYETRQAIHETTIADEKLKADVTASFNARLVEHGAAALDSKTLDLMPALLHATLEGVFEHQGADAARHFLDPETQGRSLNNRAILDLATENVQRSAIKPVDRQLALNLMRDVLRDVFYSSKPVERAYCARLSRTYILLFTLRNTPEVIEYFNTMARHFELIVASDMILPALCEYYLPSEDQMAANSLKIIRQAGSILYLTESTLEELHSHIWAADREYHNTYRDIDVHVDDALASQIDRILIRAYFYSKLDTNNPDRPRNWAQFIGNFLTYASMTGSTSQASMKSLRDTLCIRFGFQFLTIGEMRKGIAADDLDQLAVKIYQLRKGSKEQDMMRAEIDALHILRVHELRKSEDKIGGNPFGYRNWWLTQEVVSAAAAKVVFPKRRDIHYIMRPDFLINYIAYNPTTHEVRSSLQTIFPSIHGVRLASRIDQPTLDTVIKHLRDAFRTDPARAQALLAEHGDALKNQNVREFTFKLKRVS